MDFLAHLWLPIVASAAAVWIASSLAWMVVGHHKRDWQEVPHEDEFIATVKRLGIPPGSYGYPAFRKCDGLPKEERKAKLERMLLNPTGLLRVWAPISMGRNMLLTFLVFLVVSVLIGYLGWNRTGTRILQLTRLPALMAGSNFHWRTASRAGASNSRCDAFSTRGFTTRPVSSTMKISVTTPSAFCARSACGYVAATW